MPLLRVFFWGGEVFWSFGFGCFGVLVFWYFDVLMSRYFFICEELIFW